MAGEKEMTKEEKVTLAKEAEAAVQAQKEKDAKKQEAYKSLEKLYKTARMAGVGADLHDIVKEAAMNLNTYIQKT